MCWTQPKPRCPPQPADFRKDKRGSTFARFTDIEVKFCMEVAEDRCQDILNSIFNISQTIEQISVKLSEPTAAESTNQQLTQK